MCFKNLVVVPFVLFIANGLLLGQEKQLPLPTSDVTLGVVRMVDRNAEIVIRGTGGNLQTKLIPLTDLQLFDLELESIPSEEFAERLKDSSPILIVANKEASIDFFKAFSNERLLVFRGEVDALESKEQNETLTSSPFKVNQTKAKTVDARKDPRKAKPVRSLDVEITLVAPDDKKVDTDMNKLALKIDGQLIPWGEWHEIRNGKVYAKRVNEKDKIKIFGLRENKQTIELAGPMRIEGSSFESDFKKSIEWDGETSLEFEIQ